MLLDSNIIIYALEPGYDSVRRFVDQQKAMVSTVSKVEVLGYHRLSPEHRQKLEDLFHALPVLPVSNPVIEQAIALRQQRKVSLGDTLIAATALVHDLELATANINDFDWIDGLDVINPVIR
uniref:PIN domain-containing protein n=1 Tax=Candidatus Kentrum sp. LFY TaxID=2126342 RepID=A0A450UZ98_9GAMM|nr:MAG: hypothetical protein BECKLFY1418B_GA0070995_101950 [Candidatus Kentron sp. LFY]VFJ97776.1 MAG: hypothetical protein BECKLFY1418A_GA0070994_107320 [Candidatus Kentron sp. LFY]